VLAGEAAAVPGEEPGAAVPPPPWEEVIHATWERERVLPWQHLEGPLPAATLVKHHAEAMAISG
jgi:hypothetical protein